jgi:triacylglycerol esterase/lipase EstA (alpha/beta hydrolase family)
MDTTWAFLTFAFLTLAVGLSAAFVVMTYLSALRFTGGKFGWPGWRWFWHETLSTSFTQWLLPWGWFVGSGFGRRTAAGGRPIIVIHGWTQNRTNFVWLTRFLRRRGLGPFFGFNYFSFNPIEKSARELAAFVDRVRAHTGADQVDLLCHSLGGLVARTYVDMIDGHRHVRRVVTLGTPHRGIGYANPRLGASVRDMCARTGFVVKLGSVPLPAGVGYTSIYSAHDNIVYPGTASCLGERGTDIAVAQFGHFGILFCTEVAEHVARTLVAESTETTARAERSGATLSPA